jgi:hypothetical protein
VSEPIDLSQRVRNDCARVAANSTMVRIDLDRLREYSKSIEPASGEPDTATLVDPGRIALRDTETTIGFVVSLDAINFGSGYFPHLRKRPGHSGYHTIAATWRELWENNPPTVAELIDFDQKRCIELFGQDDSDDVIAELMTSFADALRELAVVVATQFDNRFDALVSECDHSAVLMASLLANLDHYDDVATHNGERVALYKRAQITPFDLHRALGGQGLGRFDDLDRLTMFADNLVPHVLRLDGVLSFESALVEHIERNELIESGSPEEVEIRACAVHAVELLVAELNSRGVDTDAGTVDGILWERGAGESFKAVPRHRTRCVFY